MKIYIKTALLIGIMVFLNACSGNNTNFSEKTKGSYVQVGNTIGQVSEFKNKDKVKVFQGVGKLNYGSFHIMYDYEKLTSPGAADGALHNREWQWFGAGYHTTKGTDFTLFRDIKDTENNFWKASVIHTNKVRSKLSTLYGLWHYDTEHGGIIKSGGRRTSGMYGGLMYHITPKIGLLGDITIGNNGSDFIQDVAKVSLRATW